MCQLSPSTINLPKVKECADILARYNGDPAGFSADACKSEAVIN